MISPAPSLFRSAEPEVRGSGRLAIHMSYPGAVDLATLAKVHGHAVNVHVLGRIEVRASIEDETSLSGEELPLSSLSRG